MKTLDDETVELLRKIQLRCGYIIYGYGEADLEAEEINRLIDAALQSKRRRK